MRMQGNVKQVTVSAIYLLFSLLFGGCEVTESTSQETAWQQRDAPTSTRTPTRTPTPPTLWIARDAYDRWTLPVPEGWYGGSYYQIKDRVSAMVKNGEGDAIHTRLLRALIPDARHADAVLLKIEMSADGSKSKADASIMKINTTPSTPNDYGFPAIDQLTTEVWTKYGQRLQGSTPGVLDVKLIRHQEDIVIKGNPVATAGFKIIKGAGLDRYDGSIIIYRPSGVTIFNLDAPLHIAGFRLKEMWTMVRSIQFKK